MQPGFIKNTLSVICLVFGHATCALGAEFTASGTAIVQSYRPEDPNPKLSVTYDFEVRARDCRWSISAKCFDTSADAKRIPEVPNKVDNLSLVRSYSLCAGSEGSETFCLVSIDKESAKAGTVGGAHYHAFLEQGKVPHVEQHPIISVLWYAFASGCYLTSASGGILEIPFIPTSRNPFDFDYAFQARYARHKYSPHLPTEIFFQAPPTIRYWQTPNDALSKPPSFRNRTPPFDKGFTIASYRAPSFREIAGMQIPEEAEYAVHAPRLVRGTAPEASGDNLFIVQHYQIKLSEATNTISGSQFIPSPPASDFRVVDMRFVAESPPIVGLSYTATNSWPSIDNARGRPEFKMLAQVANAQKQVSGSSTIVPSRSKGRWVVAMLALVSAAALFRLAKLVYKTQPRKEP